MVIIDVREPSEFAMSHVEGAVNLPPASLMAGAPELKSIPKDEQLVLYCRSGARSQSAMGYLRQLGFTNMINGINEHHVRANLEKRKQKS